MKFHSKFFFPLDRLEVINISENYKLEDVALGIVGIDEFCKYAVEELNKQIGYEVNLWSKQSPSILKKRIKYCKNPMEKKKLEQELNALYKEHKRNRRINT